MPTQNRRVATYLPKELDDRLKAFIVERDLKGDSSALIVILSEYFGVSQQVAQNVDYSLFVTQDDFNKLVSEVFELSNSIEKISSLGSLLSRLPDKLKRLEERVAQLELERVTKPPEFQEWVSVEEPVPGQMNLLGFARTPEDQGNSLEYKSELLKEEAKEATVLGNYPLNGNQLSKRFGLAKDSVAGAKRSKSPEAFLQWTKERDPDGIAWQYDQKDKLYHPIMDASPVSFSEFPK